MEIYLNKVKVEIKKLTKNVSLNVSLFEENQLNDEKYIYCKYKPTFLLKKPELINVSDEVKNWISSLTKKNIEEEKYIYLSFLQSNQNNHSFQLQYENLPNNLKKKFLKEVIITNLKNKYIVEPLREGSDLCVYTPKNQVSDENNFKQYVRYDILINTWKDNIELTVGIGSTNTYIGKLNDELKSKISDEKLKSLRKVKNNLLIKAKDCDKNIDVKANYEIRKYLNIKPSSVKKFYKNYYKLITDFIKELSGHLKDTIIIHQNLLKKDINKVNFEKNKMIFKGNNTDYSTVNGMRTYGPYLMPENINEKKLLFIYPDRESANRLYTYLSRGYRHFPGIESYVGIPANIYEERIQYSESDLKNIVNLIDEKLPNDIYNDILAICIMPFSKANATKEQSEIYYKIKEKLLNKNIPSQFIERNKIFMENFHFSLPNIVIAMLGKIGGVPWKLERKDYNQLIIGLNVFIKQGDSKYLGSAAYFDNSGIIKRVNGFKGGTIDQICKELIDSLKDYQKEQDYSTTLNKIIIHYYKTLSNKETNIINETIKKELGPNFAFAVVEINDTKTTVDLGFDLEYESLMPQSGIYVNLKPGEYLLFNNLRYWEKPINPISQEELPVKLRIYDPYKNFDENELISQVYEFSRMYWKSLKQKAQPVTTIYAKLVAEYIAHFENNELPSSEIAKKTVWFI